MSHTLAHVKKQAGLQPFRQYHQFIATLLLFGLLLQSCGHNPLNVGEDGGRGHEPLEGQVTPHFKHGEIAPKKLLPRHKKENNPIATSAATPHHLPLPTSTTSSQQKQLTTTSQHKKRAAAKQTPAPPPPSLLLLPIQTRAGHRVTFIQTQGHVCVLVEETFGNEVIRTHTLPLRFPDTPENPLNLAQQAKNALAKLLQLSEEARKEALQIVFPKHCPTGLGFVYVGEVPQLRGGRVQIFESSRN